MFTWEFYLNIKKLLQAQMKERMADWAWYIKQSTVHFIEQRKILIIQSSPILGACILGVLSFMEFFHQKPFYSFGQNKIYVTVVFILQNTPWIKGSIDWLLMNRKQLKHLHLCIFCLLGHRNNNYYLSKL